MTERNITKIPIIDLTQEEWLTLQIKLVFSNPLVSPSIVSQSLGISQELASEVLSQHLVRNLLDFGD